ncbi:MAG: hypothetical protein IPO90_01840 [Flavobacteriales bacterium]|nr:hypothetical protein [Flavobacteriales bacterium]
MIKSFLLIFKNTAKLNKSVGELFVLTICDLLQPLMQATSALFALSTAVLSICLVRIPSSCERARQSNAKRR